MTAEKFSNENWAIYFLHPLTKCDKNVLGQRIPGNRDQSSLLPFSVQVIFWHLWRRGFERSYHPTEINLSLEIVCVFTVSPSQTFSPSSPSLASPSTPSPSSASSAKTVLASSWSGDLNSFTIFKKFADPKIANPVCRANFGNCSCDLSWKRVHRKTQKISQNHQIFACPTWHAILSFLIIEILDKVAKVEDGRWTTGRRWRCCWWCCCNNKKS